MNQRIILGAEVQDMVSGFKGIAIAATHWLNGCVRITIQPPTDKDGKMLEAQTFDEPQVKLLKAGKVLPYPTVTEITSVRGIKTGGPIPAPKRGQEIAKR